MEGHSKLKYFFITLLVFLVLVVVYFLYQTNTVKPYKILVPQSYPEGTTISLYKNIPPDFPGEIILEDKVLDYSGTTAIPNGLKQTTVSYISEKTIGDVMKMYLDYFPTIDWKIKARSDSQNSAIIQVVKENRSVLVMVDKIDKQTKVTFQYEY